MPDLLIVLRTFSVADERVGRREVRPGCVVSVASDLADKLVRERYAVRVVPPAPLFTESTQPEEEPMKGRKRRNADRLKPANDARQAEDVARDHQRRE
jgi:hypothetical protein